MSDKQEARPEQVLGFWFALGMKERWFVKDPAFDQEVCAALGALFERAVAGALDAWGESGRGALALVILLDQAPRNLFRDDPRAFAADAKALAVTHRALDLGLDRELSQVERVFLYLPLEHCEDLEGQALCCRLMAGLAENPGWLDFAEQHHAIIARFGRFPHRNKVLGRQSTPEELAFLEEPDSSF